MVIGVLVALAAPLLAVVILTIMTLTRMVSQTAAPTATWTPAATASPIEADAVAPTTPAPTGEPAAAVAVAPSATPTPQPDEGGEPTAAPSPTVATARPSETRPPATDSTATATPPFTPSATPTTDGTPAATGAATATATATPTATATATATAGNTPTATPTLTTLSLAGVRGYFDETENSFRLVGEVVNNSSVEQQIITVTGDFFDSQGQLVADETAALDFLPQIFVPVGGRVPFEILVDGLQSAARWDLRVEAMESLNPIRQFPPEEVSDRIDSGRYCVKGLVRNPGERLQESLIVVAVLYDADGNVVNYGEATPSSPFSIFGARVFNFDICVSPPNDGVVRYEARALGR